MILNEMDPRRADRPYDAHAYPNNVRNWMGDSVGHWDGDTLVVDTRELQATRRFRELELTCT